MGAFRLALLAGVAIIAGLAVLGFFPVALVAAAVLVPLLMVLYLWVVDFYEDEPLWVIGGSMAWGALTGVGAGVRRAQPRAIERGSCGAAYSGPGPRRARYEA